MNRNHVNTKIIGLVASIAILGATFAIVGAFSSIQPAEARSAPPGHPDCQHLPGGCSNNNNFIQGTQQYDEMRSGHDSVSRTFGHHSSCHFC